MTDIRKAAEMALEALEVATTPLAADRQEVLKAQQALRQALAQDEQDNETYGYAKYLAECIWEKHYKEESPHWRPFDNTLGVLTQIDNMTCGLEKAQPEQEPVAWLYDFDLGDELVKDWTTLDLKHLPETANNIRPLYTAPISEPVKERISEPVENLEPVAYWNGKDMFKRADEMQYVVNWTDYYHYPLYSKPVKERISEPVANLEPVAWVSEQVLDKQFMPDGSNRRVWWEMSKGVGIPFYTAPPKREWVGLTDEERRRYNDRLSGSGVAEEIEAKLKEKNT